MKKFFNVFVCAIVALSTIASAGVTAHAEGNEVKTTAELVSALLKSKTTHESVYFDLDAKSTIVYYWVTYTEEDYENFINSISLKDFRAIRNKLGLSSDKETEKAIKDEMLNGFHLTIQTWTFT